MGEIYNFRCSCGYKSKKHLGSGLNACNYTYVKNLLEPTDAISFEEYFKNNQMKKFILSTEPCYCDECQQLDTTYHLTCELQSGKLIEYYGNCTTCHGTLHILTVNNITCPQCHKHMTATEVGHWD